MKKSYLMLVIIVILALSSCTKDNEIADTFSDNNISEDIESEDIESEDVESEETKTEEYDEPTESQLAINHANKNKSIEKEIINEKDRTSREATDQERVPMNYFIFPNSNTEPILTEDLLSLDDFTLRLAKNEIFARIGYVFKNPELVAYFNNMPWYFQDETKTGTFDDLNEIEKKNINIIDEYMKLEKRNDFYIDKYVKATRNGNDCFVQEIEKDLDGDGVLEYISVYFYNYLYDDFRNMDCEIVITKVEGKEFIAEFSDINTIPCLRFAEFDITDDLIQFYIESDGPSGDPSAQVYSFDGTQIIENIFMIGYITRYDGMSRLYSFDIYNVNCYYDLINGLTPLPKENIIGTTITRDNIELFKQPETGYTIAITSPMLTEPDYAYEWSFKEDYIGVVPKDTPLLVTDIMFTKGLYDSQSRYYNVPWLKVKTPDNIEGWFCIIYGD